MKNKKKLIIFTLVLSLLLSGTVFASVNGTFKGYSIINVKVNDKYINSDVPAISLEGRTMVPLRFVSESLGANVEWDAKTFTASISSGTGGNNKSIETLKFYSEVSNFYQSLSQLGKMLGDLNSNLSLALDQIISDNKKDFLDNVNNENFNYIIESYNNKLGLANSMINRASVHNLNITDINAILSNYSDSIDYYKIAINNLYDYYYTKSNNYGTSFVNNNYNGGTISLDGVKIADNGNQKFYRMIQDYK